MQLTRQPSFFNGLSGPVKSALNSMWTFLAELLNGNVNFGSLQAGNDNVAGSWLTTVTPATPDTEFTLQHNLGRVPSGWLTVSVDKAGVLYAGGTAWTVKAISLKCNIASVTITIFVI